MRRLFALSYYAQDPCDGLTLATPSDGVVCKVKPVLPQLEMENEFLRRLLVNSTLPFRVEPRDLAFASAKDESPTNGMHSPTRPGKL